MTKHGTESVAGIPASPIRYGDSHIGFPLSGNCHKARAAAGRCRVAMMVASRSCAFLRSVVTGTGSARGLRGLRRFRLRCLFLFRLQRAVALGVPVHGAQVQVAGSVIFVA